MIQLARTGLVLLATLVVSLAAGTSCVLSNGSFGFHGAAYTAEAARDETHALSLSSGGTLVVDVGSGSMRVRATSAPAARLRAKVRAFGTDEDGARLALERVRVAIVDTASEARVKLERTDPNDVAPISADFEIEVPASVALVLSTSSGAIDARGGFASCKLSSTHGSIAVEGVHGDLEARSSSGRVEVARVDAQRCVVSATHGPIAVSEVSAKEIRIASSSGEVRATSLEADQIEIAATHGALHLASIEGRLRARSSSGAVRAERLRGETLELESTHGAIEVSDAHGALAIACTSGRVVLASIDGALRVKSTHGAVRADGRLSSVSITSGSGLVDVRARTGSSLADDWSIASTHGDVRVELPPDAAFALDARTSHGSVDVGFEMLVPAGQSKSRTSSVAGVVHGGGGKLSISTTSGSISVQPAQ